MPKTRKPPRVPRSRKPIPRLVLARLQLFLGEYDATGRVAAFHDLGQIAVHEADASRVFRRQWLTSILAEWDKQRKKAATSGI